MNLKYSIRYFWLFSGYDESKESCGIIVYKYYV